MAQALLQQQQEQIDLDAEDKEQDSTREMFQDIQNKLQELSTIEKCQQEITDMKNQQLKTIEKMNEAKRSERMANDTNL